MGGGALKEDGNELCTESSSSCGGGGGGDSVDSLFSSSSDVTDDATSSCSSPDSSSQSCTSSNSQGPLFEFSSLMADLPIKRGLSKFFQGKSQSFTSLSDARSIEDLAKKETPRRKRMKTCKSYGGSLDAAVQKPCFTPGTCTKTIAKKSSRGSCGSLMARRRRSSSSSFLLYSSKPPPIPVHKN